MKRSSRFINVLFVLLLVAAGLAGTADAASLYFDSASSGAPWDDGTTSNWSVTQGGVVGVYADSPWVGGSDAVFEGTAGVVIVDGTITSVNSIAFDVTGYTLDANTITMTGAGGNIATTLGGTATINSALAGTVGLTLNGGGTLNLGGVSPLTNTTTVGSTSADNTLNISGAGRFSAATGPLNIGDVATFGGNSMNVSAPGTSGSITVNANTLNLGNNSAGNSLTISNGAYVRAPNSGGMGKNLGGDNNTITITGTDSILAVNANNGSTLNVGLKGSGNQLIISAGGELQMRRVYVGADYNGAGGSNNSALVTGAGSKMSFGGSQAGLIVGAYGGDNNFLLIADGGVANMATSTGNSRGIGIGQTDGSDNNYVRVTGAGSLLQITNGQPFVIGGRNWLGGGGTWGNNLATDSTAAGNHLDIFSDGEMTTNNSVYLQGVDSAFTLGDGTGISTATVGNSQAYGSVFTPGVVLQNESAMLNFNSGRLIAGADAPSLVTGPGQVNFDGPAYISVPVATAPYQISSDIGGIGGLTKEGEGTLMLSGATDYTGDTIVELGTLIVGNTGTAGLADAAAVWIASGAVMELSFSGADTIGKLYLNGAEQNDGIYGSSTPGGWLTGSGTLVVGSGIIPGDANGDLVVDAADYIWLKLHFGLPTAEAEGADLDGLGTVDFADLQILMTALNPVEAPSTTPEPCSAMLLVFGAAAMLRRRRRA